jgi:hypothetical protein
MSKPIFVSEGNEGATITASAGSVTGYPTSHLQDRRWSTKWVSAGVTENQTLEFNFGAARTINSILIANHNLVSLGLTSLDLECWNAEWVLVKSWTNLSGFFYKEDFALFNYAICRLKFVKGSALDAPPEIGMIFLGTAIELPLYLNDPVRGLETDTEVQEAMSGLPYGSSLRADREMFEFRWGNLKTADQYNWFRLVRTVDGRRLPFWFADMDGHWHLGRFRSNYMPTTAKGNLIFKAASVQIAEERVGTTMELQGGDLPAV